MKSLNVYGWREFYFWRVRIISLIELTASVESSVALHFPNRSCRKRSFKETQIIYLNGYVLYDDTGHYRNQLH